MGLGFTTRERVDTQKDYDFETSTKPSNFHIILRYFRLPLQCSRSFRPFWDICSASVSSWAQTNFSLYCPTLEYGTESLSLKVGDQLRKYAKLLSVPCAKNWQSHLFFTQLNPVHLYTVFSKTLFNINHLKPKHRPLYLKTQSILRCKHFSSLL